MTRSDLNLIQRYLGSMGFAARQASYWLEEALDGGHLPEDPRSKVLAAKSCVDTALGQVKDAQAIVHELKNKGA